MGLVLQARARVHDPNRTKLLIGLLDEQPLNVRQPPSKGVENMNKKDQAILCSFLLLILAFVLGIGVSVIDIGGGLAFCIGFIILSCLFRLEWLLRESGVIKE